MLRTSILRAARLPRAACASSASIVASLRSTAVRSAGLTQTAAFQGRVVPAPSLVARFGRGYSTSNATADATADETQEDKGESGLVTKFSDLERVGVHKNLVRSLTQGLGYETMTSVQSMAMEPALIGKDIVAQAKTGTGKTLAFLIPVIQRMIDNNSDLAHPGRNRPTASDIRAIVMSPTRELAEQIGAEARKLIRGTGIIVQTAVGGTQRNAMLQKTRREGCHLLVATPGRLNDLLSSEDSGIGAPQLEALVLDEADRMLDVGFERELRQILRYLPDRRNVPRQTLLFSATVPKNVVSLARTYVDASNFQFVQTIKPEDVLTHQKVPQHILPVRGYENMYPTLLELIEREMEAANTPGSDRMPFKALVFLSTTSMVQLTQDVFYTLSHGKVKLPRQYHIHSKLTQRARTDAADQFRNARSAILFSSDVTARGMDFPNVTHVIQVGVPPDREQYIHRLGRTGRADKGGQGWLIIAENEITVARQMLTDLPIQRVSGFDCASYDMTDYHAKNGENGESIEDRPRQIDVVAQTMKSTPGSLLVDAYLSYLGGASSGRNVQTTCDNLNDWVYNGWGWKEPPAISSFIATKRGLHRVRGLNIQDSRSSNEVSGGDQFERQFSSSFNDSRGGSSGNFSNRGPRAGGASRYDSRGSRGYERGSGRGGDGYRGSSGPSRSGYGSRGDNGRFNDWSRDRS
ncbi:uncharacterized protein SPSK_03132 [Sporothrix schenckii 1099-18]|uniref:ATP-dependent RNA helicase n=1 Tax=Sporothrix schenckii 1099-18 TaxID=1397361 RepID=A0A0F2M263_SPOSC|nr:uncharacterized protein SPSK_03132 [Sporothrix schenckii 1099-18]KJR82226.1 hypothetical protein SPSK_03132 [Sporothrix schenckii 1099-18]